MPAATNSFKRRLHQRSTGSTSTVSTQRGVLATLNSAAVIEMLAGSEFDWILIDTEHTPTEIVDVIAQLSCHPG